MRVKVFVYYTDYTELWKQGVLLPTLMPWLMHRIWPYFFQHSPPLNWTLVWYNNDILLYHPSWLDKAVWRNNDTWFYTSCVLLGSALISSEWRTGVKAWKNGGKNVYGIFFLYNQNRYLPRTTKCFVFISSVIHPKHPSMYLTPDCHYYPSIYFIFSMWY